METETSNKYLQASTQAVTDENFPEQSETRLHLTPVEKSPVVFSLE